ncbi:MAG: hypothetical protein ABI981_06155 [Betaproteobacteria bacterium]
MLVSFAPRVAPARARITAWLAFAAIALHGCAAPQQAVVPERAGPVAPFVAPVLPAMDPLLEQRILALDPEKISETDVRTTLATGPTPRIILLHGGVVGTHLLMASFGRFLSGMGYPADRIRDPSDNAWSQQPFGSTERLAGEVAWHYERDGVRPMLVGHSQGGIQTVKVLYELNGAFTEKIRVWNAPTDTAEPRTWIVDPLSKAQRPVVGTSVSFAAVVGAGGIALAAPAHWGMAARLRSIPNTVDEFTGFIIAFDPIALTGPGAGSAAYEHNGTAAVRNVELPVTYSHVFVPVTQSLATDPSMRDWLNAYAPGRDNGEAPGSAEGRATNALFAGDVWFSIKKHWCIEAQRLIRSKTTGTATR